MCIKPPNPEQMLKDVMQFEKFSFGEGLKVSYWANPLNSGVFPRRSLVQVMQVYEVAWGKPLGMGCMR